MIVVGAIMWAGVIALYAWIWRRHRERLPQLLRVFRQHGAIFVGVVPAALIAAEFLTPLVPQRLVAELIGGAAGFQGLLIATVAGWCIPLPPVIFFPLIAVLLNAGAGIPQLTALVVAWNVFALHRTLPMELPMMGRYFVTLRLLSSAALPPIAGALAYLFV